MMNMENFYPVTLEMEEAAEKKIGRYETYTMTHLKELKILTTDQFLAVSNYIIAQEDMPIEQLNKLTPMEILEILENCLGE